MADKRWALVLFLFALVAGLVWQGLRECNDCGGGSCAIVIEDLSGEALEEVTP